ncbi:MAG: M20 family metallopeptidase [Clostridia bacterium]|nr:M20 family metallopeptidase [Clostridia bacterium]
MNIKDICQKIEEEKNELFELLTSLIKINSENFSSYGNEENMAKQLDVLCRELGLETDVFSPLELDGFTNHPDYLPGRNLENRYNMVARWHGETDCDELMLMAHEDTVEIGDRNNWDFDPLQGIIKDGKIYGRGACDDKYAIATVLFVIKLLKKLGFTPKKNLLFAAYSDEEHGGSHGALSCVLKYPCEKIVSMDGREGQIWHCASGGGEIKYLFHTKEATDTADVAARAIPVILDEMKHFGDNRRKELEENIFYNGTIIPQKALRYMGIRVGNDGADLGHGEIIADFYSDKTKDIIEDELKGIEKNLFDKLNKMGIVGDGFVPNTRYFHYVYCKPDSEDIKLMLEASKEATGNELLVCGSAQSDLSVISKYGSDSAFGFGAGRDFSKEGGAHQANEFIECDKLLEYAKTIAAYVVKVLS